VKVAIRFPRKTNASILQHGFEQKRQWPSKGQRDLVWILMKKQQTLR